MNKSSPMFLDADPGIIEKNLRFIKNEFEEELENIFQTDDKPAAVKKQKPPASKMIKPLPGCCIKSFDTYDNSKIFFNICLATEIPAPVDITDEQLGEILNSEVPSLYKIPMSISNLRDIHDRSGGPARACDVALNPKFYKEKICASSLFRNFFITVIFEAIEEKFKIEINLKDWTMLKNRTHMGGLLTQMIQNRDMKEATEGNKEMEDYLARNIRGGSGSCKLIQEIGDNKTSDVAGIKGTGNKVTTVTKEPQMTRSDSTSSQLVAQASTRKPNYHLVKEEKDETVQLVGIFHLPECLSAAEITLSCGEDRVFLEARKRGYLFEGFVEYTIDQDGVKAEFNSSRGVLTVTMPIYV